MRERLAMVPGLLSALLLAGLLGTAANAQENASATISVTASFDKRLLASMQLELICSRDEITRTVHSIPENQHIELPIKNLRAGLSSCQVLAILPVGYSAKYSVSGSSVSKADKNGCQYARMSDGQINECNIEVIQLPVNLTVYKKWIGASGMEADVEIELECESGDYSGFRYINQRSPDGWEISDIDAEGILCNVSEAVRDNFRPDIIDCQGLFILPGRDEECTMVNTKIVKRIEMLNRYGKIVMIVLVLAVGLVTVRRMS